MAAIAGKGAKIRYTSVAGTSSTDNASTITTGVGGAVSSVQINSTLRRHWDRSSTAIPDLYLNSTLVPTTAIAEINYVQGIFNLNESRTSTGVYTIDCHFLTSSYLSGGQSWAVDFETSMYDTTSFANTATGSVQARTFVPGLTEGSVSINRLASTGGTTGPIFYDRMNLQSDVIVELIASGVSRYEAYGYVTNINPTAGIDALTVESVDITLDGPLYYSTT
jgi:hypothetical protein